MIDLSPTGTAPLAAVAPFQPLPDAIVPGMRPKRKGDAAVAGAPRGGPG